MSEVEVTAGGEALRKWLAVRDITQEAFARRNGWSQGTVCRWIRGHLSPSIEARVSIAAVTGIKPIAWDRPARMREVT